MGNNCFHYLPFTQPRLICLSLISGSFRFVFLPLFMLCYMHLILFKFNSFIFIGFYTKVVLWYDIYIYIQHFIPSLTRYSCSLFLDIDMDINIILSSLMEHGKAIQTSVVSLLCKKTFQIFQIAGGEFLEADGGCLSFRVQKPGFYCQ